MEFHDLASLYCSGEAALTTNKPINVKHYFPTYLLNGLLLLTPEALLGLLLYFSIHVQKSKPDGKL
jgi:hypothetical protein